MNTKFNKKFKSKENIENGLQQQVDRLKSEMGKLDSVLSNKISILEIEINSLKRGENNG
jgi:hypothetical protein